MLSDVIVIGAGAAGLAAALGLARRGWDVSLLEARERIGGRVWPVPLGAGVPAELGAEFIHGPAPSTRAILREIGVADADAGGDSWVAGGDGELQRSERGFAEAAMLLDGARELTHDETVDQFLARFAGDPASAEAVRAARLFVEGFDAADPALASVRGIADEWHSGVDARSARPAAGYGPLLEYLERACAESGVALALSTRVRRIAWHTGGVEVDVTGRDGATTTQRARLAILTVPVGVLRDDSLAFEPPLPPLKATGLRSLEMGSVLRVALRFRFAFWEQVRGGRYRDAGFFRSERSPFAAFWTQLPRRDTLIVAWAGGPKAQALASVGETELVEQARDAFGELLGEERLARSAFAAGAVHDWSQDPFARGAYSYVLAGGGGAREALAAPLDDTLFFAGEATCSDGNGGTVNGALASGERAAEQAALALARRT